jgi:hypothetical protein
MTYWAIEWGYKLLPDIDEPDREKALLNELTIAKNNSNIYWFGSEQEQNDPRAQDEDLGDNAMKAGSYGLRTCNALSPTFRNGQKLRMKITVALHGCTAKYRTNINDILNM